MTITVGTESHSAPGRGLILMLGATLMFVSLDALAKYLSQSYPVPQVVWARYAALVVLLVLYLGRRLPGVLRTRRLGLQVWRAVALLLTTGLFFSALSFLPLADATAIMFVAPILVTALSMPLLGERVGPRRWASIVVGFGGALMIIRPGTAAMDPAALLVLAAATCYALYQIMTRRLSRSDPPMTTLFYSAIVGAVLASVTIPFEWVAPRSLGDGLALATLGVFGGLGHFLLIKAFDAAPAATISGFGYFTLIWATLVGFVLFGDLPDLWTVLGALVIAGSGLYILHRERVRKAARPPAARAA
jgi:drug/metabolite transporter (DMT)-like permease